MVDFTRKALDEVNYIDYTHFRISSRLEIVFNDELKLSFYFVQFGDHCAQLEKNITLVQERAKMEAEMDDTWGDVDDHDVSRNVSFPLFI